MRPSKTVIPVVFALALSLTVHLAGPAFAQGPPPSDLRAKVLPSFVDLSVQTAEGRTAIGAGFLTIKDGILATAYHIVGQARSVVARFSNGEEFECSGVIDKDIKRNVALLRIKLFGRPVLKMEPVELPPGTLVVVPVVKDGAFDLVEASVGEPSVFDGVKQARLDGDIPGSASGAPVVDAAGNVVGIVGVRNIDGKNVAFAVPAVFLLALDSSLPTQPWGAGPAGSAPPISARAAATVAVTNMMAPDEVDARIGRALFALTDDLTTLGRMGYDLDGMGFLSGVPEYVYRSQQELDLASAALQEIRTDNELRLRIAKAVVQMFVNEKAASEHYIRAVVIGQQVRSWDAQSQDGQKRSHSIRQTVRSQLRSIGADLEALAAESAKFREFLPVEQRYQLGLAKRPSGFGIGAVSYARDPFRLYVNGGSLASKMGLEWGDVIVSAAGRTFTPEDDLEDFKLIIRGNLGKTLPVAIERGGKQRTIKLRIPKEIPADAFYTD